MSPGSENILEGFAILRGQRERYKRLLQYKRVVQGKLPGWQWETREVRIDFLPNTCTQVYRVFYKLCFFYNARRMRIVKKKSNNDILHLCEIYALLHLWWILKVQKYINKLLNNKFIFLLLYLFHRSQIYISALNFSLNQLFQTLSSRHI